ncbi:Fatty acid hydroxylase superfamily protein [Marinomonas aquimarina]|uniref:Fatty acid hydroxylase superfamily protein n=1 Tax=Marinomonas aquimarina TaxID=295068 RepID=A0A1A8T0B5_9GAMM|nr:sterol desaturase family protein [Marinomonas aquimarina]SBS25274.1 Fatty acid hydroxylase superfamily protein [Marinomonas aquimarina]
MIDYQLRILLFLLFVTVLLSWQFLAPRAPLRQWRSRWRHNLGLFFIDALCVRLFQPLLLTGVALLPAAPFAPLSLLPSALALVVALTLLDLLIYWQHRLFHRVDWLWRLHRVHHSDPELDTTSAVRFHPLEILLSLLIKAAAIWLLGIPATAVLVFDILLNALALFNHTNVQLKPSLERPLRRLIVTPAMHRIHHSRINTEANRNFGFCLSIWDRCFKSYLKESQGGDQGLNIGLPQTQRYAPKSLFELLKMPFSLSVKGKGRSQ